MTLIIQIHIVGVMANLLLLLLLNDPGTGHTIDPALRHRLVLSRILLEFLSSRESTILA
jgi:hypothetical protein